MAICTKEESTILEEKPSSNLPLLQLSEQQVASLSNISSTLFHKPNKCTQKGRPMTRSDQDSTLLVLFLNLPKMFLGFSITQNNEIGIDETEMRWKVNTSNLKYFSLQPTSPKLGEFFTNRKNSNISSK